MIGQRVGGEMNGLIKRDSAHPCKQKDRAPQRTVRQGEPGASSRGARISRRIGGAQRRPSRRKRFGRGGPTAPRAGGRTVESTHAAGLRTKDVDDRDPCRVRRGAAEGCDLRPRNPGTDLDHRRRVEKRAATMPRVRPERAGTREQRVVKMEVGVRAWNGRSETLHGDLRNSRGSISKMPEGVRGPRTGQSKVAANPFRGVGSRPSAAPGARCEGAHAPIPQSLRGFDRARVRGRVVSLATLCGPAISAKDWTGSGKGSAARRPRPALSVGVVARRECGSGAVAPSTTGRRRGRRSRATAGCRRRISKPRGGGGDA